MRHQPRSTETRAFGFVPVAIAASLAIVGLLAAVLVATSYLDVRRIGAFNEQVYRLSKQLPARIARAEAEIESLGTSHPWAGRYQHPVLWSPRMIWFAPEAGCIVCERGCGGVSGVNWGSVREEGDVLRVTFAEEVEGPEFGRLPVVYEIQRGGDRKRLQAQHELRDLWLLEDRGDE